MTGKPHFWQGEWIGDSELGERLDRLAEWIAPELEREALLEPVLHACDALSRELSAKDARTTRGLRRCLSESGVASDAEASLGLLEIAAMLRRDVLELKLKRELGSLRPFLDSRAGYEDTVFEAWSPLGFLVHVSPQNAFAAGAMSVLEGLLSGNVNFLKTGASETLFPQLFLEALCGLDPTGFVARRVIVARISSKRQDLLEKVFRQSDGIAAWGGEESIEAIRKNAPSGTRLIEWGHKISFIYVTRAATSEEGDLYDRIARECCALEQQACSSPQCVYLDCDGEASGEGLPPELGAFAEKLGHALDRVSPGIPRILPSDGEAAEISLVTECHKLESSLGRARVISAQDSSWRVLVEARAPLQASPLFRSIWVKPLPRSRIVATLRPMRKYLQTAGVACALSEAYALATSLRAAGVERIRRVGEMLQSYSGEPHDGVYALQRYCRRTSVQLSPEASGISSFQDLRPDEPARFAKGAASPVTPPVTPKDSFTNEFQDSSRARLYFKSGGSTGDPKLSTYDYDQYREQMRLGADGLVAAGFDPIRDRPMNLFFSGGLYGGFLSVFSALEVLEAVQFPMAAQADHKMVAQVIVKNRVDTLLGMPSYLMSLFENEAGALGAYGGVRKIFYGGEHFSEAQSRFLREKFGIELIRSLAYGSVDIGPIGYQCRHCEGGVHHLHHGLHFLEILKMEEDRPVEGSEAGRLIFSPRSAVSNKPKRYEIGDVGHWVGAPGEPCECGRLAPRFKLLGRMGDIFRIGSMFLNYQKLSQILSAQENYSGELQVILENDGLKEKLVLLISQNAGLDPSRCRETCLANYHDLEEVVVNEEILLFETRAIAPGEFERVKSSGKLRHILDRRSRA